MRALIAASRTAEELERFNRFCPSDADMKYVAETGREVLRHVRPTPGACVLMSAVLATMLEDKLSGPALVVAGSLAVGSTLVFGNAEPPGDIKNAFNQTNLSWDGHCWVSVGEWIADVSVFRTAYSAKSPPFLRDYVVSEFGPGRGMMIAKSAATGRLIYTPQCILTRDQTDALFRGARAMFAPEEP
ncbi:MAG: hypothetical protein J0H94_09345 [Rhizobiales bacterium]|jgi:hypothetical protein|nr:hypothetical protein [Hyphomicrobiales bacterium]